MSNRPDQAIVDPEREPMDELLMTLLAEGWTHQRVANFCDISTRTIRRRLEVPEFRDEVSRRKRERLTSVAVRLTRITDKALDVMEDAMEHGDVKVRMSAAKTVLDYQERYHRRAVFEADVNERILAMEREFAGLTGDGDLVPIGDSDLLRVEVSKSAAPERTRSETIAVESDERT